MNALITGADGFVGVWLLRRLLSQGHSVTTLARGAKVPQAVQALPHRRITGDVTRREDVDRALEGVDVVFHLAGIRRAAKRDDFIRVNAEGTRTLCEAMVVHGTRRLVLCGSLAASGPSRPDRPRREEDPLHPEEWYGESKAQAEEIAFSYRDRLEVAVARPPRIMGPGDRENLMFFKLVSRGLKLSVLGGPRPMTLVDVEDVVDFLLLLAEKKEAVGEAFFVAGSITTLEDMQDHVAKLLGKSPRTLRLSAPVLRGLSYVADMTTRVTGRRLPLNRKLAKQLLAPAWTCSPQKAERLLGFHAKHSVADSLTRSALWYREQGWI